MGQTRRDRLTLRRFLLALLGSDLVVDEARLIEVAGAMGLGAWSALGAAVDAHGIALQASSAIARIPGHLPADVVDEVRARALTHTGAHLRSSAALGDVLAAMGGPDLPWALLKGPVLADFVYGARGRRSFSDLDVLLHPRAVRPALERLESAGATVISRNWALLRRHQRAEVVLQLPGGTMLDLHWGLLGSPGSARDLRFTTADLLDRRRQVPLSGPVPLLVPALSAADNLVHVAVHGVLAGLGPLRLSVDLDQICRHDAPEVGEVADALDRSGAGLAVAVALDRVSRGLGSTVARQFLQRLPRASGSDSWRWAMRAFSVLNPPSRAHEAVPLPFLIGSTRSSTSTSAGVALRQLRERVGAARRPGDFLHRMRHLGPTPIPAEELLDVDEGHREALLRELDAS